MTDTNFARAGGGGGRGKPRRGVRAYLLRRHHGDDGHSLFPHHLPEVRTGVLQGPLCGDVVPLHPADRDLA